MAPVLILDYTTPNPLPVGRLLLESGTMASWGLAISAVVAKRWDDEPGKIASASLLAFYAVSWAIPERWNPWAIPSDSRWLTGHPWWWLALSAGVVIAVAASWDSRRGIAPRLFGRVVGLSP